MKRHLASDSMVMALATVIASGANYGTNVWLARALDIDAFGDAALIVSSLLLLSAAAIAVQLAASHLRTAGNLTGLVSLHRRVGAIGIAVGAALAIGSQGLASVLNSTSTTSFVILGISIPIYLLMSIDRGVIQGEQRFVDLGTSLVVEAVSRLAITVIALGVLDGAAAAATGMAASFAVTRLHARLADRLREARATPPDPTGSVAPIGAALALLLFGQVLIANGDVVVMSAMAPDVAGTFAAVALIGRLSFPLAWALINVAFPKLAITVERRAVARSTALMVAGLAVVTAIGTAIVGPTVARILFGSDAVAIIPWLVPYSIATGAFALATLGAVIDVAVGRVRGPAALVAFGVIQTIALAIVAPSGVGAAVWAQVGAMGLAAVYAIWSHRDLAARKRQTNLVFVHASTR